jgi:2-polyprenyl-6-hydroxyphenyl methylase / 3-demethylubiquinone-9 3-methyltransferase
VAAPIIELDSTSPNAIDGRHIRAVTFQAVRLEYVASTLNRLGLVPAGQRALVAGSGRGLLALGLARMGLDVTAADPSAAATAMARQAAAHQGLEVEFHTATTEDLDLPQASFDLAFYADTFEITDDPHAVIEHAARLLRPDGVLFYDTVNRTMLSRLIYLAAFQAIPVTRIMPRHRYSAARLRPPAELGALLAAHGLRNEQVCAFKPKDPRNLIKATIARRQGKITDDQLPPLVDMVLEPDGAPVVTYLGYARKT